MTATPASLRILAALRKLDEAGLVQLLQARRVPVRGLSDPIDLAEWLERSENLAAAVDRLSWAQVQGLRRGEPQALRAAAALQLTVPDARGELQLLPTVADRLAERLPALPRFTASSASADLGFGQAGHAAQLANDALWLVDAQQPVVHTSRAGVRLSATQARQFAAELDLPLPLATSLFTALAHSKLIAPDGDVWAPTELGRGFPLLPASSRWRTLTEALRERLSVDTVLERSWQRDPAHPVIALGLADTVAGALTSLGALVLEGDLDGAERLLARRLPEPVTGVYVQPDLTVIAPGTLSGDDDAVLRSFCELERRGAASQYRLTVASVERALLAGATPKTLRAELAQISVTSIPQPVNYLLDSAAERFGQVRVLAQVDDRGRFTSRVRAAAGQLLDAMRVDARLTALALRSGDRELTSQAEPQTTLRVLRDARYPAVLEDRTGRVLPDTPKRTAVPKPQPPARALQQAAAALAENLTALPADDDRSVWLRRRLEIARRDRTELLLEIALGADRTTSLEVVPLAVTDRRLRARDCAAQVERTVPLRAIVAVEGTRVTHGN